MLLLVNLKWLSDFDFCYYPHESFFGFYAVSVNFVLTRSVDMIFVQITVQRSKETSLMAAGERILSSRI